MSVQRYNALNGVCSAVLRTTVFPHARAGATFHADNQLMLLVRRTEHGKGKVPRNDLSTDTQRFMHRVLQSADVTDGKYYSKTRSSSIHYFSMNFIRPSSIISYHVRRFSNIIIPRSQEGLPSTSTSTRKR